MEKEAYTSIKSVLGRNIKKYRKNLGMNQAELAEKVGITIKHLGSIETGMNFVSADVLESLSKTLGVPVYMLFTEETIFTLGMLDDIMHIVQRNLMDTALNVKKDLESLT